MHSYQVFKQWNSWLPKHFLGREIIAAEIEAMEKFFPLHFGKHISLIGVPEQIKLLSSVKLTFRSLITPLLQTSNVENNILIEGDPYELPLLTGALDALVLPHTLELVDNPRQLLAEACRVIKPEGLLVIFGFNPYSPWGVRKWLARHQGLPWSNQFLSSQLVKKWLKLAEFSLENQYFLLHRAPLDQQNFYKNLKFYEWIGDKVLPQLGGVYMLVARAKVIPLTPIRTTWKQKLGSIRISTSFSGHVV